MCPQLGELHTCAGGEALPSLSAPAPSAPRDPDVLLLQLSGRYPAHSAGIAPHNERCPLSEGNGQTLPRAPQTPLSSDGEQAGFAAPGEFAGRWTPGEGAAPFPSTAAKHVKTRYAPGSAGTQLKPGTLNTLLSDYKIDFKNPNKSRWAFLSHVKASRQGSPEPWASAGPAAGAPTWLTTASACSISVSESSTQLLHTPNLA